MPSNPQDTVGTSFYNVNTSAAMPSSTSMTLPLTTSGYASTTLPTGTTTTWTPNITTTYYPWNGYAYSLYYQDQSVKVAALEGEVKALREMLTLLLGGWKKPAAKRRARKEKN